MSLRDRFLSYMGVFLLLISGTESQTHRAKIEGARSQEVMTVDGVLSESVWQRPGVSDFKMKYPVEGNTPSQKTEVWVAYDNEAVYVAARMHDTSPDSIIQVLGRRDYDVTADWFCFYVDPYNDKRTGYFFAVSAAGSMQDGTLYNDDWNDNTWDGVWEAGTNVDQNGWTAELRIPLSQLRFIEMDTYVWGVNFRRSIGRHRERDFIVYTPNKESGFVSRFVELVGIEKITPPLQVEILPYVTSRAEYLKAAPNDPFKGSSRYLPGMGADIKVALTSNLTLNATVNPDFGQVEVDPAVVNLSDVESYFQEKRPFFVEGYNIFSFGYGGANSNWGFNWGNPEFLYSRRIGRAPQGSIPFGADFLDYPIGTHILGAGKITGKVGDGWNVGMIHAVTKREYAQAETSGVRIHNIEVEPLTYYGIGRIQKDFNDGRQGYGVLATYTHRLFKDSRLENEINTSALTGGIDGWTFLDDEKEYVITGGSAFSSLTGSTARMTVVQTNSRHYYQRPDATYLRVDSNATSLNGFGGRFALNKQKGQMLLNVAFGILSPELDVNDLGFQWRNDYINYHFATGYKWTDPTPYYNSFRIMTALFQSRDFGNRIMWHGWWQNWNIELPNFWGAYAGYTYNPASLDTRSTRGGPAMQNPIGREFFGGVWSDSRKEVTGEIFGFTYIGGGGKQYSSELYLTYKPAPNINFSFGPSYSKNFQEAQWVTSYDDPTASATYGRRYIFAHLDQTTVSANLRLNWTFTPQLSLQLFMQPLMSSGKYAHPREFIRPGSFDFRNFGEDGSTLVVNRDPNGNVTGYDLDPDGAGSSSTVNISNPDFNFTSLRGNSVLRWEYRPGSTIYLVWTQSRSEYDGDGEFRFRRSFNRLFSTKPDNIFMVKFTYWFNV
ncbi:MAG: carbohydrate binding family 9 domain-containing protein [Ignavibacteriales bacterium]|nr:carbohydrate binding family 9 domain-containing protein [Ignavibacteriales bacterium]